MTYNRKRGRPKKGWSHYIYGRTAMVQEGDVRKTMAARGLVNGRGPRSGRDSVFRMSPS